MPDEKKSSALFICRRKFHEPVPRCYKCGKPATCFCDFRNYGIRKGKDNYGRPKDYPYTSLYTCDKPMCSECAHHYGEDTDFCDEHDNELSRYKTDQAEKFLKEKYGDNDD